MIGPKLKISDPAIYAFCRKIRAAGYLVYIVGGAARDLVLKDEPTDWDFTTDATPEQIMMIFSIVIPTGIKHGTVTVVFQGSAFEITTFRAESGYSDHRRPDTVAYTTELKEDLKRRDFTINALAYDPLAEELVDEHGGLEDLQKKLVRCIGIPQERFKEDALRILRAPRFASKLDFRLEGDTLEAMRSLSHDLHYVSPERIREELIKLLQGKNVSIGLMYLVDCELIPYLLSDLKVIPDLSSLGAGIQHLSRREPSFAFAALFYSLSRTGRTVEKALKEGKYTNREITIIFMLWRLMAIHWEQSPGILWQKWLLWELRKAKLSFIESMQDLCSLYVAIGKTPPSEEDLARLKSYDQEPLELHQIQIKGEDLIALGVPRNKELGDILKALLIHIWQNPEDNTPERLSAIVQARFQIPLPDFRPFFGN
jgi:tRNA nucleotidyltransferase (CCA-adding enzyme)